MSERKCLVTPVDEIEFAKNWLDRAIAHLKNSRNPDWRKEDNATTCLEYAIQNTQQAIKRLDGTF